MPTPSQFALYVRAVPGQLVARYGTRMQIGVSADKDGVLTWDTDTIHAISLGEMLAYGREYRRAIADGGLQEMKEADYAAWVKEQSSKGERAAKWFSSAREKFAADLANDFPGRKVEDLTDGDLGAWAHAKGFDVTAPSGAGRPKHETPEAHAPKGGG